MNTRLCILCGAVIEEDWAQEHSDFHLEVERLQEQMRALQQALQPQPDPEVGFRGPAYDEPI